MLPGTKVTPEQAQACANRFENLACDHTDPLNECLMPGAVAKGEACMSASQCATGYCKGGGFRSCGVCAPPAPPGATVGDACRRDTDCNIWATCEKGKCTTAGKAKGQKCNQNESCNGMQDLGCFQASKCLPVTLVEENASCKPEPAQDKLFGCYLGSCARPQLKCIRHLGEGESCGGKQPCAFPLLCEPKVQKCVPPQFDWQRCG